MPFVRVAAQRGLERTASMSLFLARLRFASIRDLALCAAIALAGAVVLDRSGPRGGEFFVGILFGLAVGLGLLALGLWQRKRLLGK